jgi:hypothetical protein
MTAVQTKERGEKKGIRRAVEKAARGRRASGWQIGQLRRHGRMRRAVRAVTASLNRIW